MERSISVQTIHGIGERLQAGPEVHPLSMPDISDVLAIEGQDLESWLHALFLHPAVEDFLDEQPPVLKSRLEARREALARAQGAAHRELVGVVIRGVGTSK